MGNQSSKQHHHINGGKPKKFVHWKSAERPSPPGRPILISSPDQEPDVITLKWNRPQTDGGSPIIGYIIEQRRMGSSHWVRATPTLVPTTEVAISGLEPGWRYQFRAIAENVVGKSDPSDLSDPLTVTLQRNAITVPRFVKELEDTTVIENERVEMRITILGQPPPEINWFKDGFEIFSSRRTKIVNDNESSVLIIHQCAFTDEGEIKCTATNRAGHVATKAYLKVVAPPKIRLPRQYEDGLIVEAGEVLRLKVGLAGQPFPTITWLHEGQIINNGGRYELETTEKNSSLKIDNIKRSDRGEYTLRALNYLGEDVASFLVTVTSKPNPPGKIQLTMSFGRSVTLTWTAPDDDGGCKIGNYIIEYFRIGWNVWLKAATTRQLTTKLHDLIEGSEYKFRVKAENPYGVSDPSEESDILFIPDPKRGITKPVREHLTEDKPPLPPKRRALSPIRNFLGVGKKTNRSPSPNSRALDVQMIPELFENEDLHREMSYGTPYTVFNPKEHKRTVTFKENSDPEIIDSQKSAKKPNKVSEGTQSLGLQKAVPPKPEVQSTTKENATSKLSINQRFQMKISRSPTLARRKMSLPGELEKLPVEADTDNKDVKEKPLERHDSLIIEKVQQFFKRSPSPRRKNAQESEEKASSLEKVPTEQPQRKDSLIMEKVQNFFRKSPTPNRKIITTDSSSLPSDLNVTDSTSLNLPNEKSKLDKGSTEKILSAEKLNRSRNNDLNLKVSLSQDTQKERIVNEKQEKDIKQKSDQTNQRPIQPNPTIEISEPKEFSDIPKKDEAHISSEFMLVLHPIKRSKEIEKQESFDLELEDALSPPPVSFSVPELTSEYLDLQMPPLRRSVSSTELLYERAMARFYEAVELEESEKSKQRKISEDYGFRRKRLGSIGKEERLSTERRPSLIRRLSEEVQLENNKQNMKTLMLNIKKEQEAERQNEIQYESKMQDDDKMQIKEYSSDYTESTASSSNDSIEKFKSELLFRTRRISDELETYHPRRMDEGNLSPYRSPTPDQSAVILTRPMPPPDPDFVPKPILKRSSAENMLKDDTGKPNSNKDKSKESGFSFTSIFKKDKAVSDSQQGKKDEVKNSTENNKTVDETSNKGQNTIPGKTSETINSQRSVEDVQKKKLEQRQSSEEERKVVVEYYSDIVKELGGSRSRGVPIYMRGGVYSKSDDETENQDQEKKEDKTEEELMARALERPRLSIVERLQSVHVQNKSKSAVNKPNLNRTNETDDDEEEKSNEKIEMKMEMKNEKVEVRGRQSVRRPLILKKEENEDCEPTMPAPRERDESESKLRKSRLASKKTLSSVQKRFESDGKVRNGSKSPVSSKRQLVKKEEISVVEKEIPEPESRPKTPEQLLDEAQENVRSAISYITDVGLFIVACWVYIFKDVRLVIPILALLVYRQLGEALNNKIPDWMKRKRT